MERIALLASGDYYSGVSTMFFVFFVVVGFGGILVDLKSFHFKRCSQLNPLLKLLRWDIMIPGALAAEMFGFLPFILFANINND